MASFTDSLRLNLQDTGSNSNTWGQTLNKQFELLEAALAGTTRIVLAANDYELSANAGSEDEARSAILDLQGQPSSDLSVIVPAVSKLFLVRNNTTGDFAVTVRTKLGSGVDVPRDQARWLYCDADDVLFAAATAEDTLRVAGMTPGNAVERDVNAKKDGNYSSDTLLDRSALDDRYVASGAVSSIGNFTTGDMKYTIKQAEDGWVRMQNGSIGPAGSGATAMADDDCEALYKLLWNNVDDDYAEVSGVRGATAANDWNAGKSILLPETIARALAVAGSVDGFAAHALGSTAGEEEHTQTKDELVPHSHEYHRYGSGGSGGGAYNRDAGADTQTEETGGGEPFNVLGPRTYFNLLIKL